ncbi:MAG: hypothetical protein ACP5JU_02985 [Minisyncoccia bacterium]
MIRKPANLGTIWHFTYEEALKDIFEKCEKFGEKKYRVDVLIAKVVKVKYQIDKDGNVKVIKREKYMDITQQLDACLKNVYNSRGYRYGIFGKRKGGFI